MDPTGDGDQWEEMHPVHNTAEYSTLELYQYSYHCTDNMVLLTLEISKCNLYYYSTVLYIVTQLSNTIFLPNNNPILTTIQRYTNINGC